MIAPKAFIQFLKSRDIDFFTGVPCSYFKHLINCLEDTEPGTYYIAPNEGSALALASGAFLGGRKPAVMIQNSGLGNLINPLTSLNAIYDIPVPLFISGRAYGIPDEPQHRIIGARMGKMLDSIDIAHWDLPKEGEAWQACLNQGLAFMEEKGKPAAFFVKKGTFEDYPVREHSAESMPPMKRIEAIETISRMLRSDDLLFSTTGKPSRELFSVNDRPGNFYMQGSMGHIASVALGCALAQPDKRVIILDGDGAFMMHMGTASMIGRYAGGNVYHLVLDNESYETTGDQDTTSATTDFASIAKSCGYRKAMTLKTKEDVAANLPGLLAEKGPVLVRIKINRLETKDIPRITTKYEAHEITGIFRKFVESNLKTEAVKS